MAKEDLKDRAIAAMNNSPYRWRTVRAVAKELNANAETVEKVFTTSGAFVRAKTRNARGESLYSTTERYKRNTPLLGRLLGAAANTISSGS